MNAKGLEEFSDWMRGSDDKRDRNKGKRGDANPEIEKMNRLNFHFF